MYTTFVDGPEPLTPAPVVFAIQASDAFILASILTASRARVFLAHSSHVCTLILTAFRSPALIAVRASAFAVYGYRIRSPYSESGHNSVPSTRLLRL